MLLRLFILLLPNLYLQLGSSQVAQSTTFIIPSNTTTRTVTMATDTTNRATRTINSTTERAYTTTT